MSNNYSDIFNLTIHKNKRDEQKYNSNNSNAICFREY